MDDGRLDRHWHVFGHLPETVALERIDWDFHFEPRLRFAPTPNCLQTQANRIHPVAGNIYAATQRARFGHKQHCVGSKPSVKSPAQAAVSTIFRRMATGEGFVGG
jgi:hypothetical protein